MIEFAKENEKEQIKNIWKEAFGDSGSDILRYLDKYLSYVLTYKDNGAVKGILSILPIRMGDKKGRYIYAVATDKNSRKKGISTKLLEYAKSYIREQNEEFAILVPAKADLFGFYEKRGFIPISSARRENFSNIEWNNREIEIKKIFPQKISEYRQKYFKDYNFIEWGLEEIKYIYEIYDGNCFELKNGKGCAFAICSYFDGFLDIKELFSDGIMMDECIGAICKKFGVRECRVSFIDKSAVPSAMLYPEVYENVYFNLAMD